MAGRARIGGRTDAGSAPGEGRRRFLTGHPGSASNEVEGRAARPAAIQAMSDEEPEAMIVNLDNRAVRRMLNLLAVLLIVAALAGLMLVMFEAPGAGGWLLPVAFLSFAAGAAIRLLLAGG